MTAKGGRISDFLEVDQVWRLTGPRAGVVPYPRQ